MSSPKPETLTTPGLATSNDAAVTEGRSSDTIPRNPSRFLVNKVEGEDGIGGDENGLAAETEFGAAILESEPGVEHAQPRGVHFDVGLEKDDDTHTHANSGTYGTSNLKSFRNVQTVEKIPHVDHYRNIMSVEGAMAARPTLAQLHDEEYGQQPSNNVEEHLQQHFERFGMLESDKNLESAEFLRPSVVGQKFGWIQGVFMRCVLSILGTMLYLRISWVAGVAGIGFGTLIVFVSAIVITVTAISMCAICTNGEIKGGGAYYMISRSLGPEFGGSIGIIFSFANAVASAMCVVGFAEVVRDMLQNEFSIKIVDGGINDVRVISYGTIILLLCVVMVGVSFESKAQLVLLAVLALSLVDYVIGTFIPPDDDKKSKGMTGYRMDTLQENFYPDWKNENFFSVFSVFFPACTGIMAGANISGDLTDPQKAIPKGTLLSILVCMIIYIVAVWTTGATFVRSYMPILLFDSMNTTLATIDNSTATKLFGLLHNFQIMEISGAWRPLVTAGIFAATLSSALAAFVSAPKVFQAVCKDRLFPYIHLFGKGYGTNDEPRLGYALAFVIALAVISIGDLNTIAPIISNFYLMSYALVNFACFDATFAGSPGFRPGFRYYNLWVSLSGAILCLAVMFIISWWNALITFGLVAGLYVYVLHRKPDVNWGSSTQAHSFKSALQSALKVAYGIEHVKNYRPQILVLTGNPVARPALVDFASNITKDSSLLMCGHVVQQVPTARVLASIEKLSRQIYEWFEKRKVKAFYIGVAHPNLREGVQCLLQVAGLGKLKPNVVLLGFKSNWRNSSFTDNAEYFNIIHDAFENNCGVAILRVPGSLDLSEMMSQHNVGDTHNLKLPDPTFPSPFDASGSGLVNIMDSSRQLSPEAAPVGLSRMISHEETTIDRDWASSNCSFAEKLYVASSSALNKNSISETGEDAQDDPKADLDKMGEMLNLLNDGSVQSGSNDRSPSANSPTRVQTPAKTTRIRNMSKKQKEILEIINQFQTKVKKPVIHVYWLFDDGGLGLLIPHLLTLSRSYVEGAKLNVFTVASSRSQLEREQRSMAALLSRFRIDYSDVFVIPDLAKKPAAATIEEFEKFIAPFRATTDSTTVDESEIPNGGNGTSSARGLISNAEYTALRSKTYRHLRLREILLQHSREATLVVATLPVPRKGILSAGLYLAWLDFVSRDLPPTLLIRGNQQSVLTFYS